MLSRYGVSRHINFVPLYREKMDLLPAASDKWLLNASKIFLCLGLSISVANGPSSAENKPVVPACKRNEFE